MSLVSNTFADLLKLDSSVDLRQRAPNGLQGDLSIRGGGFGQTLILLDGLRLNDVQSGHHNLDIPAPLEAISSIEILKGSGSTLYGSDAVGGVVNFITRAPESSEIRLRGAVGNFGTNQQRADLSYAASRWSEQLTFSRDFSTGFIPNRDYRNLSLASRTSLTTGLGTTAITLANNDRPFGAEQFYGNYNSWERTRTWFASARQSLGRKTDAAFAYRRHTDCSCSIAIARRYSQTAMPSKLSRLACAGAKPPARTQTLLRARCIATLSSAITSARTTVREPRLTSRLISVRCDASASRRASAMRSTDRSTTKSVRASPPDSGCRRLQARERR